MNKMKILLVDDDPTWLDLLSQYLHHHMENIVIRTATDGRCALNLLQAEDMDVILLDVNLTETKMDGIAWGFEFRAVSRAPILMVTSLNDAELAKDSFASGAVDFIDKEDYVTLPKKIRQVCMGQSATQHLAQEYQQLKQREQLNLLTTSEQEVLSLLRQGYKQAEIEKMLYKSHNTIRSQIKSLLKKLGVKTSKEAVLKIESNGIYDKYT